MSMLTEAVLVVSFLTADQRLAIVSHDFEVRDPGSRQSLTGYNNDQAGGHKAASDEVFHACFNYVSTDAIVEWFTSLDLGPYPRAVLIVRDEHGKAPEIHTRGTWTPVNERAEMAW